MIEVSIAHDKDFNKLSDFAQLIFLKALPHTDDYGRFEGDPEVFKGRIDPLSDKKISQYEKAMAEIADAGLWLWYETDTKKRVVQYKEETFARINAFLVKSRGNSEYPAYMKTYESISKHMEGYAGISHIKIKQQDRDKDKEERKKSGTWFDEVWKEYPSRTGKPNALKYFNSSVKNDVEFSNFKIALKNYLSSGNVKNGFIKNGSTWFHEWQDWVEPTEVMMKGNSNATTNSGQNRKGGSQYERATFRHGPEELKHLEDLESTLRQRDLERGKRS